MTVRDQFKWWTGGLLALVLFLWAFSGVLAPFLFGMALAYFADPIADRLEAVGCSRVGATVIVTLCAVLIGVFALLMLVPLLIDQIRRLIAAAPGYIDAIKTGVDSLLATYAAPRPEGEPGVMSALIDDLQGQAQDWGGTVFRRLLSGGLVVIDIISLLVITPVVAFYLLLDWDRMVATIDGWLPRQHAPTVRKIAKDIDGVLAGFVRGQVTVCLILGGFYAIALTLVGLDFGVVIGLIAGVVSFIPYVGAIIGMVLSVGVALAQFWGDWTMIGAVVAVFFVGQAVEGNVLTPNLVGGKVGLHPVALIFALTAFGSLFGFPGLLIAVPAAAAIGVIARWGLAQYQDSRLYRGPVE